MAKASLPEHQSAFIADIAPYLVALPGGVKTVAERIGLPVDQLQAFLNKETPLESDAFNQLVEGIECQYDPIEYPDRDPDYGYTMFGHHTLMPTTLEAFTAAVESVSGGGDVSAIYGVVCLDGVQPMDVPSFLVVDRQGHYFLFKIEENLLAKAVIDQLLVSYNGFKEISRELYELILEHSEKIESNPAVAPTLDNLFFSKTTLAFGQVRLAGPCEDSGKLAYGIEDQL